MDRSKIAAGAAATLVTCAFVVSVALAGEPGAQVRTQSVGFQDLNLASTSGVNVLNKRIHSAAERVCAVSGEPKLGAASSSEKCTKEAVAGAIEKLDLRALTALAINR